MRIQQKVDPYEKICKWKADLIGQANRSKVVYLSADPNVGPFKDQFPLAYWILRNVTKLFKQYVFGGFFVKKNTLHWLEF